jgi:hypothetical protein
MFGSRQLAAADPARLDGCGDNYLFGGTPWREGFGWPAAAAPAEDWVVFYSCLAGTPPSIPGPRSRPPEPSTSRFSATSWIR